MTKAMERALKWLGEHGGSGVLDRYGRVLAGGEVSSQFHPTTWLRLVSVGRLAGYGGRIRSRDAITSAELIADGERFRNLVQK